MKVLTIDEMSIEELREFAKNKDSLLTSTQAELGNARKTIFELELDLQKANREMGVWRLQRDHYFQHFTDLMEVTKALAHRID